MQVDREQKRHSYLLWPNRRLDASSLIELDVSDSLTRSGVAHNDSLPPAKFFPTWSAVGHPVRDQDPSARLHGYRRQSACFVKLGLDELIGVTKAILETHQWFPPEHLTQ